MRRLPWEIALGLLMGLAVGLIYAWVVAPIRYVDTTPSTLRVDFKDAFRVAIAASYSANHNLDRAKARLFLLEDPDPVEALSAQAQRMLASGEAFDVVQNVASLASDMRAGVASLSPSSTPATTSIVASSPSATAPVSSVNQPPPTATPTATEPIATEAAFDTPTARPTRTAVPTASAPFQLVSNDQVCNNNLTEGLMQISVLDRHHHQMPGVEIDISWSGGEERFFTGLKPEIADGYADFVMQAGATYTVRVAHSSTPVSDLSAPSCPDSAGQSFVGGLKLVFQQP